MKIKDLIKKLELLKSENDDITFSLEYQFLKGLFTGSSELIFESISIKEKNIVVVLKKI